MAVISHHEGGTSINIPTGSGKKLFKVIGLVLLAMFIIAGGLLIYNRVLNPTINTSAQNPNVPMGNSLDQEALAELQRSATAEGVTIVHTEVVTLTEYLVACEKVPGIDPAEVRSYESDKNTTYIKADIVNTIGQHLTPYYRMTKSADGWDIGAIVPPRSAE